MYIFKTFYAVKNNKKSKWIGWLESYKVVHNNFRGEDKYLKLRVKLTTILGHFTVDYGVLKKLIKAMGLKVLLT